MIKSMIPPQQNVPFLRRNFIPVINLWKILDFTDLHSESLLPDSVSCP